ncbi:hypothetical protein DYBT9275_02202 [Dyadobacter sp. CECT 9275]|uniref:Uncharacterized protein n=1 Tax=Dyadobacter helix TaxID=2822344 RepID=A0A916JAE9_9BACT|nr:hypothetical protein [Dyadobacter sp. CECT 9275]CAG4999325.1 hypothetical protein DYBT9275_02202 [Dyadobacter sp. CECT 9275]
MKPYSEYSAEELAMEKLFIRWVRFPDDPAIRTFWEGWILKNPSMKETVDKAKELVFIASDWKPDALSGSEVNSLWGRIMSSLEMMSERDRGQTSSGILSGKGKLSAVIIGAISVMAILLLFYYSISK